MTETMNEAERNQTKRVCDAWRKAADILKIQAVIPFMLEAAEKSVDCIAFLPHYGSPNGMVIGLMFPPALKTNQDLIAAARSKGLFYSFINVASYANYDAIVFKDALLDWEYFGPPDLRPSWMPARGAGKAKEDDV